ncbi:hypothetical protein KXX06_006174 [Aspergillus fumigatus]|nr:hypothetical protein KXX06_006174 [Aspergillus fumigatus]
MMDTKHSKAVSHASEVSGRSLNEYHQAVLSQTSGQHDDEWGRPDSELPDGLLDYRLGMLDKPEWDGWKGGELEALVAQEAERYKRALLGLLAEIHSGSEDQLHDIITTVQKPRTLSEAVCNVLDRYHL